MPLWKPFNSANSAPKFVTDATTGETGIQEYGVELFYIDGTEGYPVGPGWARRVTRGSRVYWESITTVRGGLPGGYSWTTYNGERVTFNGMSVFDDGQNFYTKAA